MKQISYNCCFSVFSEDELSAIEHELLAVARETTFNSYAPYSKFNVGVAVLLEDGTIVKGSNQENAVFGVTQCAERNALHHAACYHPNVAPLTICIVAKLHGFFTKRPVSPCGICRQSMIECEQRYGKKLRIMMVGTEGVWVCQGAENLLPFQFSSSNLQ